MRVQECAQGFEVLTELPKDPQGDMIKRQREFQKLVGGWSDKLKDYGAETFCLPQRALHHLDMGIQECSEAWDLVEGGWKHHKRNPDPPDAAELLMELVDVAHFIFNAYLFMGGQPEQVMVAASVGRSREQLRYPEIGLDEVWTFGEMSWERNGGKLRAVYGHGEGSHGLDWEKEAATRINYLRTRMVETASSIRYGLEQLSAAKRKPNEFPAGSGYVYIELMPWLTGALQAIPGCDQATFYSAFVHKNDINFKRQERNY